MMQIKPSALSAAATRSAGSSDASIVADTASPLVAIASRVCEPDVSRPVISPRRTASAYSATSDAATDQVNARRNAEREVSRSRVQRPRRAAAQILRLGGDARQHVVPL